MMYQNIYSLLSALFKITIFFREPNEYNTCTIDGLFGLSVIEGVAGHILDLAIVPRAVKNTLLDLKLLSRMTINHSLSCVKIIDKNNFATVGFLLESGWRPIIIYQDLQHIGSFSHFIGIGHQEKFTEKHSDLCFSNAHKHGRQCSFDANCLDLMLVTDSTMGYFLTHQVLYATLIESYGCKSVMIPGGSAIDLRKHLIKLCTRVYSEYLQHKSALLDGIGQLVHSPRLTFDLMLEQVFACGRIGFVQFADDTRLLDALLAAQEPRLGCFRPPSLQQPQQPPHGRLSRSLRAVRFLPDSGCELHLTGVAASAAAVYLMLLLDPGASAPIHVNHDDDAWLTAASFAAVWSPPLLLLGLAGLIGGCLLCCRSVRLQRRLWLLRIARRRLLAT